MWPCFLTRCTVKEEQKYKSLCCPNPANWRFTFQLFLPFHPAYSQLPSFCGFPLSKLKTASYSEYRPVPYFVLCEVPCTTLELYEWIIILIYSSLVDWDDYIFAGCLDPQEHNLGGWVRVDLHLWSSQNMFRVLQQSQHPLRDFIIHMIQNPTGSQFSKGMDAN